MHLAFLSTLVGSKFSPNLVDPAWDWEMPFEQTARRGRKPVERMGVVRELERDFNATEVSKNSLNST
jgi:hypothetical protein